MYLFSVKNINIDNCLDALNQWGLVHIPNYLSSAQISHLVQEFQKCFNCQYSWLTPFNYSLGQGVSINRKRIDRRILPITSELFGSSFMAKIANGYLGKPNFLNHYIYVVKDVVGSQHVAQDLHYDVTPTLKFFLYLNDTTVNNGAFQCVPGSQSWTRQAQHQNRLMNIRPAQSETRQIPEEIASQAISIEGKAGTMIVFHTDIFHRAGICHTGERWVMRGHSRLPQHLPQDQLGRWRLKQLAKRAWRRLQTL